MNQRKILLQLLPGFIPLLIFIIADEIWGTKIGLIVAISTGIAELGFYWIKDRKFDLFILFDTLLIVGLGVISLKLENDVFFKLKPALLGVLICAFIGVAAFSKGNFLALITGRYMKGIEISDDQMLQMKRKMQAMFWIFMAYTALVFYSVWYMSKEGWAFVSGGLFYIIFGVYFGYEFLKTKFFTKGKTQEEWLPLVNEKGEVIGKAPRSVVHSDKHYLHPVVHLHVFNDKGELYLQKRPMHKKVQPGKWDTAVGGHIAYGETLEKGLERETLEEIGITDFKPQLVANYIWESDIERELVFCFATVYNGSIRINPVELTEGKFWTLAEIEKELNNGLFTPNFVEEYRKHLKSVLRRNKAK